MRKVNPITPAAVLSLLLAISVTGCQSKPKAVESRPGGRSMVLDSPRMQQLTQGVISTDDSQAWYASRNDARLTTNAGYESPTYEAQGTYTYDRQYTHGSHVRDYYNQTTYRASRTEAVR